MGTKREGKPRYSGAALRAYAVVSPFNLSADSRTIFLRKNGSKRRCKGRCHEVTEGIRSSLSIKKCGFPKKVQSQAKKFPFRAEFFLTAGNAECYNEKKSAGRSGCFRGQSKTPIWVFSGDRHENERVHERNGDAHVQHVHAFPRDFFRKTFLAALCLTGQKRNRSNGKFLRRLPVFYCSALRAAMTTKKIF